MAGQARFYMVPAETPIADPGLRGLIATKSWFMFFSQLYKAAVDGISQPPMQVTVSGSPFLFTATVKGQVFINGGTTISTDFIRPGNVPTAAPPTFCVIPMNTGDQILISFATPPTVTFYPM